MEVPIQIKAQNIKKMYDSLYDDLKLKYGLTMNEIIFLLYLDKNHMKNTAREIVEDLMLTKSHISKSVDSLAREKIIIRVQDKYDRKVIRLYISDTANELIKELRNREMIINQTITDGITPKDIETFNRVLDQMKKNVSLEIEKNRN